MNQTTTAQFCPVTEVTEDIVLSSIKKFKELQMSYFKSDFFSEDDAHKHHKSLQEIAQIIQNILTSMCGEIPNLYFIEMETSFKSDSNWGAMKIVDKDYQTVISIDSKTNIEEIMTDSFPFNIALMHLHAIHSGLNSFKPPFKASIYASNIFSGARLHPIIDQANMSKVHLVLC